MPWSNRFLLNQSNRNFCFLSVSSEGLFVAWLKRLLLLTVPHDGYLGVGIFWVGCLLSYYSFFTISYQARHYS